MDYIVDGLQLLTDFQLMDFQLMDYIVDGLQLLIDFQLIDFKLMDFLLIDLTECILTSAFLVASAFLVMQLKSPPQKPTPLRLMSN